MENLVVDWISFNIPGLTDQKKIARRLFPYFNIFIKADNEFKIFFYDHRNRDNVLIRKYLKIY